MIVFSSLHSENATLDVPINVPINESILQLLKENPSLTTTELGEKLNVNRKTIQRQLNVLKEKQVIERIGSNKRGSWIVH